MKFRTEAAGFLTLLVCAVAWLSFFGPVVVHAQQIGKAKRIVYVVQQFSAGFRARLACFKEGLGQLGWTEGHTSEIEVRSAEGRPEALPGLAERRARLSLSTRSRRARAIAARAA